MKHLCSRYWVAALVLYFTFLALVGAGTVGLGVWAISNVPAPHRWYMSGDWDRLDPGFRYDPGSGFDYGFGYDFPYDYDDDFPYGYYGYDDDFPYGYYDYDDDFPYGYYGYDDDFPYGYYGCDDDFPYDRYYDYGYRDGYLPREIDGFGGADYVVCPGAAKKRLLGAAGQAL